MMMNNMLKEMLKLMVLPKYTGPIRIENETKNLRFTSQSEGNVRPVFIYGRTLAPWPNFPQITAVHSPESLVGFTNLFGDGEVVQSTDIRKLIVDSADYGVGVYTFSSETSAQTIPHLPAPRKINYRVSVSLNRKMVKKIQELSAVFSVWDEMCRIKVDNGAVVLSVGNITDMSAEMVLGSTTEEVDTVMVSLPLLCTVLSRLTDGAVLKIGEKPVISVADKQEYLEIEYYLLGSNE